MANIEPRGDSARPVESLIRPRSIAIIGASADPRSFGGFVSGNLARFGYGGALHLVSRSSDEIDGRPCVRTIDELPTDIDLAVLAIPEAGVLDAVQALGRRRCRSAVLFASGYAETGDEGRARQQALAEVAHASGIAVVGPNCMGFTNFADRVPVTFEPLAAPQAFAPRSGGHCVPVAVLAQSGAMAANMRDAMLGRGLPISLVFSTGNEVSVGIEDVLAHCIDDAGIGVIALYAEQIRRPGLFLALAARARAAGKPVVLLMPGRSARAREGAASHTGALAGDHASAITMLRRQAVVCVDTLDELFDVSAILSRYPEPPAGALAFMTGSGAMKNIALDFCDDIGLELPALQAHTVTRLREKLPAFAVAENPLDYTTIGVRQPGLIGEIIDILLADASIGQMVLSIPAGPTVAQRDKTEHIVPALARAAKPVVLVVTGDDGPIEDFFVDAIRDSGVPFQRSSDRALRAVARIVEYGAMRERAARADSGVLANAVTGPARSSAVPADATGPVVPEYLSKRWLAALGIPIPIGELARDADAAVAIAGRIGWPVVIKAQSPALAHKSEAGAVIVGLHDEPSLRAAWARLHDNVASHRPGLALDGVLVEAMGDRGLELVVGARRDPDWGPVVMAGLGGIWIEALRDVRLLAPDAAVADIVAELHSLKAAPMLDGIRGAPAVDAQAVARVVAAVGAQMLANPAIDEIDINPLIAYPDRVLALDALIVLGGGAS
ncbi:MAG: acetate--CoA ligase family protein [Burkholderiaceae bacterium]